MYSIQHYVIKFVGDLRQVSGFLQVHRYPPTNKLSNTIKLKILLKAKLNATTLTPLKRYLHPYKNLLKPRWSPSVYVTKLLRRAVIFSISLQRLFLDWCRTERSKITHKIFHLMKTNSLTSLELHSNY